MKAIILFILIAISTISCSQQNEFIILKKCVFEGTSSFPKESYTCEKIFVKGQDISYKIKYSSNGWQIYDSISYENKDGKFCIESYRPLYNYDRKLVEKYELVAIDCSPGKSFLDKYLEDINDRFFLSRDYLTDLNFLLERNPSKDNSFFKFNECIIPSLFTQYGIPSNEQMSAFKLDVQNGLIVGDQFFFKQHILKRQYLYEGRMLKTVQIVVENKKDNEELVFQEYFQIIIEK